MPVIDFSKASDIKVVGYWKGEAVVKNLKYKPASRTSGEPAYRLDFTLDNKDEFDGTPVFKNGSLQPQSLFSAKQNFVGCGCDPDLLTGQVDTDIVKREIVGNRVVLDIEPENYEDDRDRDEQGRPKIKQRNSIMNITPA